MPDPIPPAPAPAPAPAAAPVPPTPPATPPGETPPADPAPATPPATPPAEPPPGETPPPAAPAVPDKYEFKVPEGYYDPTVTDRVSVVAKDLKLPTEAAQRLLDVAAAEVSAYQASVAVTVEKTIADWEAAARADKDFGGVSFDKNVELAKSVLVKFGNDELIKGLTETGYGSHPEMVRFMVKIGRAMKEDDFVDSKSVQSGGKSSDFTDVASRMFDHPTSQPKS